MATKPKFVNYAARRKARINQHAGMRAALKRAEAELRAKLDAPTHAPKREANDEN